MANVQHNTLTGSELHEPKGVAAASADTVYVADGASSGAWVKIDSANIDTTSIKNTNKLIIMTRIDDISTAGSIYIPTGFAGTINKVTTVIDGAIGTSDATLTLYNAGASSAGTITIAFTGSTAGDVDTLTPVTNNTFSADSYFRIATDGASTNAVVATIMVEVTMT